MNHAMLDFDRRDLAAQAGLDRRHDLVDVFGMIVLHPAGALVRNFGIGEAEKLLEMGVKIEAVGSWIPFPDADRPCLGRELVPSRRGVDLAQVARESARERRE